MRKFTLNVFLVALLVLAAGSAGAQTVHDLTPFSDAEILSDTLDGIAEGDTVLLKPGMTYDANGFAFDKSVTIQSSDPSSLNRPKINCASNFNFTADDTIDHIIFRNIEFFDVYGSSGHYIINSNVANVEVGKVELDGCYVHDMRGVVRMKDNGPGVLDEYIIRNSVLTKIRDYGILTVDMENWRCNHIVIQNSTISHAQSFITSKNVSTSLLIDGCILNAVPSTGRDMFRWRTSGQDTITDGITVRNTLWGPGWDELGTDSTAYDAYDGLASTPWTFENTWITSDLDIVQGADSIEGANFVYPGLSTELWANTSDTAPNYAFADETFAGIGNAGDQRWAVATDDGGWEVNISHPAFNALGTLINDTTVAGLKVYAHSGKNVVIDDNNKSLDGMDFTQRLKFGGSADFDEDGWPRGRVLEIDLVHSSTVRVAAMSASGSEDRILNLAYGNKDTLLGQMPVLGASLTGEDFNYYGNGTKLWLYSPSSGVNVYYLKVAEILNIDAKLESLSVSGDLELNPAFDPEVTSYGVEYPNGTTTITVSASPSDPNATVVIASGGTVDVSAGPTNDTITVTAEDGTTIMEYIIAFTEVYIPSDVASLLDLTVDAGELFPAFSTTNQSYTVDVPLGVTEVTVGATPTDPNATVTGVEIVDVSAGGTIQHEVVCTAEDGTTTMTYTIDFISHVGIGEAHQPSMSVYPTISDGTFNVEFTKTPGTITVYDPTGRRVLQRKATASVETIDLDRAGIYMIYLESENDYLMSRVMVVK